MAKLVKKYKKDFFIITNAIFRDKRLSYQELGLLMELLSLPDDWSFSIRGLSALHQDGKSTIARNLNKLIDYGYLYREQKEQNRTKKGLFDRLDYYIYDNPLENPHFDATYEDRLNLSQNWDTDKTLENKGCDQSQNWDTDNRNTDNGTIYSTNISSIKELSIVVEKMIDKLLYETYSFVYEKSIEFWGEYRPVLKHSFLNFIVDKLNEKELKAFIQLDETKIYNLIETYSTLNKIGNYSQKYDYIKNPDGFMITEIRKAIKSK